MTTVSTADTKARRDWAAQARGPRPVMPSSLRRLLEAVNRMTWQPVLGLQGLGPRARVLRMGDYTSGQARYESAEVVRQPDGSWLWACWVRVPEIGFDLKTGAREPTRLLAERAAEAEWRRMCEGAFARATRLVSALRGSSGTVVH